MRLQDGDRVEITYLDGRSIMGDVLIVDDDEVEVWMDDGSTDIVGQDELTWSDNRQVWLAGK